MRFHAKMECTILIRQFAYCFSFLILRIIFLDKAVRQQLLWFLAKINCLLVIFVWFCFEVFYIVKLPIFMLLFYWILIKRLAILTSRWLHNSHQCRYRQMKTVHYIKDVDWNLFVMFLTLEKKRRTWSNTLVSMSRTISWPTMWTMFRVRCSFLGT